MAEYGATCDICSLLSGNGRDYLVRNNGDQVKIEHLKGKTLCLYFSASWCAPCHKFTPTLTEAYNNLLSQLGTFEVIFISRDSGDESFTLYFSKMPWLAIPFADSEAREKLDDTFAIMGIPTLVTIYANGNFRIDDAAEFVTEHSSDAYSSTSERLAELNEIVEAEKKNQTIRSLLVCGERDYVVSSSGNKIPVSELEGKYVGLYFAYSDFNACQEFTRVLHVIHEKLKQDGESFEIVTILQNEQESSFDESVEDAIVEHNLEAWEQFPFSQDKMVILEEEARAKLEQQTLESLLVDGEFDYLVGKDGTKIPVSDLVGKTILLYFSAGWCAPCHAFLPKLIQGYNKIKSIHSDAFEIVFVSSDEDEDSYNKFYSSMPWLALPLEDPRNSFLNRIFEIRGIPSLVAIGPSGKTVSKDVRKLLMVHGAEAYPFTEERIKELQDEIDNVGKIRWRYQLKKVDNVEKGWPEKIKIEFRAEQDLVLTKQGSFICNGCGEMGVGWRYRWQECDFDLHPACALEEASEEQDTEEEIGHEAEMEGYVLDVDVCRKIE